MKYKKLFTISILPLMWLLYVLFELISGRINNLQTIFFNMLLMALFAIVGLVIYYIGLKYEFGFRIKSLSIIFLILLVLDQGVKILIKLFCFNKQIELIPNMLSFHPIINTNGSWLNARFGTSVSFPLLISVNIIAILLFIEIYRYYLFNDNKDFWSDMCFAFVVCGALCSLIDKVFYGGSLDFIGISDLFIADIKDIYINLGILFFVLTLFNNNYLSSSEETTFKEDIENAKKFFKFIKQDISGIYRR